MPEARPEEDAAEVRARRAIRAITAAAANPIFLCHLLQDEEEARLLALLGEHRQQLLQRREAAAGAPERQSLDLEDLVAGHNAYVEDRHQQQQRDLEAAATFSDEQEVPGGEQIRQFQQLARQAAAALGGDGTDAGPERYLSDGEAYVCEPYLEEILQRHGIGPEQLWLGYKAHMLAAYASSKAEARLAYDRTALGAASAELFAAKPRMRPHARFNHLFARAKSFVALRHGVAATRLAHQLAAFENSEALRAEHPLFAAHVEQDAREEDTDQENLAWLVEGRGGRGGRGRSTAAGAARAAERVGLL